jgi:hypothetical protein
VTAALGSEQELVGSTVVVVGLGASGRAAAKLAYLLGAQVVGVDINAEALPLQACSLAHPPAVRPAPPRWRLWRRPFRRDPSQRQLTWATRRWQRFAMARPTAASATWFLSMSL